ncbi:MULTISPECIES: sigma-54 interaction domain-containing protein [Hymenobacter]|uniref:Sigma-54 dependent transcriptional regulator n=2 Tax=Hymenobacter TaxID=89966 RepID=A0ABS6WYA2_9BACT|nr:MULTISPECIES: sigma-54 dependent transcriptional regulator [Hymenobacter]MBO3270814.1 sigma-54-dependent Fis family transcriptional regulator [Hymenobacter defluvii]MBW3128574.1 sigma-54 dependent transcriptional regulator [Hymenobacter profundi]QNE39535.1 sigma-54-dependent Fis family transcriptional regulator [Hymenobacter sp. NBH84]
MTPSEIQSIKLRFGIIGNAPALNYAIQVAAQVAPTDMTVLITGESGSGKESFSKIIHALSPRKHGQFIAINCGAIPEGTIDSELFGHEKGSFTGANEARKGYFEVTNGGTIFLDEIGEMPLGTQARLLRVLENGDFIRVGSSKVQKTDVRVVAATNVNLLEAVRNGRFREDLYYRLNTVPITVPPLRERGDDIYLLFRKFATDFADRYRVKPISLSPEAVRELQRYRFPGNIRQLKNVAEQMSVLEMEREVDATHLRQYLPQEQSSNLPMLLSAAGPATDGAGNAYSERDLLYKVLFDMRRDMTDLKKLVLDLAAGQRPQEAQELLRQNSHLFTNLNVAPYEGGRLNARPDTAGASSDYFMHPEVEDATEYEEEEQRVEDIPHETEEETLSLEAKEKEMIIKALKKHNNKRKYAAHDLGISERTLYRKLKQYDLEQA